MILVLCDVINKHTWWHAIQLDSELRKRLQKAQEKNQSSITVKIDSKNEISSTPLSLFKKSLSRKHICLLNQ